MWYSIGKYKELPSEMGQKMWKKGTGERTERACQVREKCEWKAVGHSVHSMTQCSLAFSLLSYFPGRGTLDTVLEDEMWTKDLLGWVSILLKPNQTKNRSWHNFLILLLSHLTILIAWNMEEKLRYGSHIVNIRCKVNILKLGAESRKGLGLESVLRELRWPWTVYLPLDFSYTNTTVKTSNYLLCYMNHS